MSSRPSEQSKTFPLPSPLPSRPPTRCRRFHFRIGPPSSVQLATTYLDEEVRLGQGSRGSLFVFTRGGAADGAGMDLVGLEQTTPGAKALLLATFFGLVTAGAVLWATESLPLRVFAVGVWLVTAGMAAVMRQGGVAEGDNAAQQWREYQAKQQGGTQEAGAGQQQGSPGGSAA